VSALLRTPFFADVLFLLIAVILLFLARDVWSIGYPPYTGCGIWLAVFTILGLASFYAFSR
jgi:hypothetical protein